MSADLSLDDASQVKLSQVNGDNWREIAKLSVSEAQKEFVAEPLYYLALCSYGDLWHPLAICIDDRVIGFMMWAEDTSDGSCWLGGILIDQNEQNKGYGRKAVQIAIADLSEEHGYQHFALSYSPKNSAKYLYHKLGFKETNQWEDDEVVARLFLGEDDTD